MLNLVSIAWKTLFESLWKTFDIRFQLIVESLKKHRDLVDREANTLNIVESKIWRSQQLAQIQQWQITRAEEVERYERERSTRNVREAIAWLGATTEQEDMQTRLHQKTRGQKDSWIIQHPFIVSWLAMANSALLIWLHGKPGGGKSASIA